MSSSDDVNDSVVDKVKATVGDLVDQSGDRIAQVVDTVTDALDEGTGGTASAMTAKVDEAVFGALTRAVDAGRSVSQKAGGALGSAKKAVGKEQS